ncbi:MAG TPA: hypothetical protein VFB68_10555 [Xanthobacteraceae bacterium]|nr:hypothetical protein [Xanthobacteraceae bacterium]
MDKNSEVESSRSTSADREIKIGDAVGAFFRHPFGYFLLPLATVLAALLISGFCFSQFRYLTDDELVASAIDDVLRSSVHVVEKPSGGYAQFVPKQPIHYRSRAEFQSLNPNCCKIVPHDREWISLWHQLYGKAAASVFIRYVVRHVDDQGETATEAVARRTVGNCGAVLNLGH